LFARRDEVGVDENIDDTDASSRDEAAEAANQK
jgi:hypothetical protein